MKSRLFFASFRQLLLLILVCATLTACAALPEVRNLSSASSGKDQQTSSTVLAKIRSRHSRVDLKAYAALEDAVTGHPLIAGNRVTLLYDGPQTMAAMLKAIQSAKSHIHLETYIFDEDDLGMQFADALIARQKAGVQVNILYDSVGTLGTSKEFFARMQEAGIHLEAFNPVNPLSRFGQWKLNNRDHRKILIVDGIIAFTGGVNISENYSKSSAFHSGGKRKSTDGWRDTHIQIEGPAVAALQWMFIDTWYKQQGERGEQLPDLEYFPPLPVAGNKILRVLGSEPNGDHDIYKAYALAIQQARHSIHITSAYFVPDQQTVELLQDAAKRGVEVSIIVPGVSDVGAVFWASQSYFAELLNVGIKIYQLQISVLHAKTAVIDGVWSTIGSTNIDTRSFLHNNEVNVIVLGDEFGKDMESAFQEDLRHSVQITQKQWEQRPFINRLKEWAARRLEYWL